MSADVAPATTINRLESSIGRPSLGSPIHRQNSIRKQFPGSPVSRQNSIRRPSPAPVNRQNSIRKPSGLGNSYRGQSPGPGSPINRQNSFGGPSPGSPVNRQNSIRKPSGLGNSFRGQSPGPGSPVNRQNSFGGPSPGSPVNRQNSIRKPYGLENSFRGQSPGPGSPINRQNSIRKPSGLGNSYRGQSPGPGSPINRQNSFGGPSPGSPVNRQNSIRKPSGLGNSFRGQSPGPGSPVNRQNSFGGPGLGNSYRRPSPGPGSPINRQNSFGGPSPGSPVNRQNSIRKPSGLENSFTRPTFPGSSINGLESSVIQLTSPGSPTTGLENSFRGPTSPVSPNATSPKEVFGRRPFLRRGKAQQVAMKKDETLAETSKVAPFRASIVYKSAEGGSLYLSTCPGKKMAAGRNGKSYLRSLNNDIQHAKDKFGITSILCLLNPSELRTLGVHPEMYDQVCSKRNVKLINYPIIEMAAPSDAAEFDREIVDRKLVSEIKTGGSVLVHCRGGVGRAGLVAACLLLRLGVVDSTESAVARVRHFRDPRSVESQIQINFVRRYANYIAESSSDGIPCLLPSTPIINECECQPGVIVTASRKSYPKMKT